MKDKIKKILSKKILQIIMGCFSLILLFVMVRYICLWIPLIIEYFSTEESRDILPSVIESTVNVAIAFVSFIATTCVTIYLTKKETKEKSTKEATEKMRKALHSDDLNLTGHISLSGEPFGSGVISNGNIKSGLVVKISSNKQLFPIDYAIANMSITAYDNLKRIINGTKIAYDERQIVIYFEEEYISDREPLYSFIVNTFYLNRYYKSLAPTIYLKFDISFYNKNNEKNNYNYQCSFSVNPCSCIDLSKEFTLKLTDTIESF